MNNEILTLPDGVPVNERVQHAAVFSDITDEQRQAALERLQQLADDVRAELFGRGE